MASKVLIAGILSFFIPGLGQMYLGQIKRGIIILIGVIGGSVVITYWLGWWGILPMVALQIWQIYDACKIAKTQEPKKPEQFDAGWENKP